MIIFKQSTSIKIRIGPFVDATDAVTPEKLSPADDLLDPLLAIPAMPQVVLDEAGVADIRMGRIVPGDAEGEEIAVVDAANRLLAIAAPPDHRGMIRPVKVFVPQQ
ncbi:hypothetical protein LCGC14_2867470 [marine sediment metagenome]|uniref:tRNA pseudouridine synthase II TruB subfamily 1 C-terminal domain-containing protein n=1 Tax=marine sediment metagenome TaxID=412755 RepID=A0A0F9AV28_9ZZZZ